MDDVIYLISETFSFNDYGVRVPTEVRRQVFCKVKSITRSEFFDGGRAGLNPEMRFDIFGCDYNGEEVCEWRGNRYAIYRTSHYESEDYLELYVERKGGTNGTAE